MFDAATIFAIAGTFLIAGTRALSALAFQPLAWPS